MSISLDGVPEPAVWKARAPRQVDGSEYEIGQSVALTGYLRFPEPPGWLTPAENRDKRLWFVRDHPAIASALGWGLVAPFYVDLEQPAPANGIPRPGPLDVHLKDDHLQYAVTWFMLAGAVLIAFAVWARGRRQS